jgi:nitrate reductase gamma subunit
MSFTASFLFSLIVTGILFCVVYLGVGAAHLYGLFGIWIPYAALLIFTIGVIARIISWARSPVPFRIPSTCGQEKSLPWIKSDNLDNPSTTCGVIIRMALEVLFFRSLFRNTSVRLNDGPKVVYWSAKWLWLAGLVFHWSFLIIILRHLRFFTEPIPAAIELLEKLDGLFEIAVPTIFLSDAAILAALTFLVLRRIFSPKIRYISLPADYFPLFIILAIVSTGVLMRLFAPFKVDLLSVKQLILSLYTFNPVVPEGIGLTFYIHLFFVCVLFAYFPFSKLMHMGGVFLSPTRNLANTNRMKRHVNPWDYPVKVHPYEEYEDEFREKMKMAEIAVDKE